MDLTPKVRLRALIMSSMVSVSPLQKIERYYLSGRQMCLLARQNYNAKKYEKAYFYYLRYMTLFLEEIPKHPNYAKAPKALKIEVKKNIVTMLPEAEYIKQILLKEYQVQQEIYLEKKKNGDSEGINRNSFSRGKLQSVTVPYSLIPTFLDMAQKNTYNDIETCAFLTGVLTGDYLSITTLLISQQSGTSDECFAENDEATFNAMETNNLLTFGWIHTHPSQESFLSSVDLHTSYGYQSMLPEAIAIVCAPKYSNNVYHLTDMGMKVVGNCKESGFHTHKATTLFEEALHVIFVDDPTNVIDLREEEED